MVVFSVIKKIWNDAEKSGPLQGQNKCQQKGMNEPQVCYRKTLNPFIHNSQNNQYGQKEQENCKFSFGSQSQFSHSPAKASIIPVSPPSSSSTVSFVYVPDFYVLLLLFYFMAATAQQKTDSLFSQLLVANPNPLLKRVLQHPDN